MGLLKDAEIEQTSAKLALYGIQGSGKSTTAFLIAIGLIKTFHKDGVIAMYDSEGASDFLVPIAKAEGVRFVRHKSTSFKDLVSVMVEAERMGANVFIADTVTRAWIEIVAAYQKEKKRTRMEFQDWGAVKGQWREQFVDRYMVSPLHAIVVGRAGDEYDTVEVQNDNGEMKRQQERIGSKFAAEKGMGYEPNLLIEMEGKRVAAVEKEGRKRRTKKHGGTIVHVANVLKDRSRSLMGMSLEFPNLNDYKVGGWKPVFEAFAPHWSFLNIGQRPAGVVDINSSSGSMFREDREQQHVNWGRRRDIAIEEIKGILGDLLQGSDNDSKKKKNEIWFELFATRSATAVEGFQVDRLEEAVGILQVFSSAYKATNPSSVEAVIDALRSARGMYLEMRAPVVAAEVEQAARAAEIRAEDEALAAAGELPL